MKSNPIKILYVHYGDNGIRGSEICLLNLLATIDKSRFVPLLWCNSSLLAEQVKAMGIDVIESPFSLLLGWQAPRYDIASSLNLVKQGVAIIKQHQVNLIHCNSAAPCQWMSIAALRTQTKLLTHLHAPYPLRDRLTLGLYSADKVISVNSTIQEQLKNDGTPKERLQVIPNGLDIDKLSNQQTLPIRKRLGISKEEILLSTVNYLNHAKGADNCIKMLGKLHKEHSIKAHLMVIGDGPDLKNLMTLANDLHVKEYVHFMGNSDDVQSLIQENSDYYVCGSREESFGLAIAEAAIARLAIVAPNVGGIPMIIKHGITGMLYESEDIDTFAKYVALLINEESLRESLIQGAWQHVNEKFDLSTYSKQFEQCYQELYKRPNKAQFKLGLGPFAKVISIQCKYLTSFYKNKIRVSNFLSSVAK